MIMATWFTITFEGEPTEADFARVAELAAEGFTSGQLLNEPGAEYEEGPATGYWYGGKPEPRYIAHFTPEAWVRDQAVEVDAAGPQEWDCTAYATDPEPLSGQHDGTIPEYLDWLERSGEGTLAGEGVLDNDDVFRGDPAAPGWIAAWQGPFTIRIRYAREGE